MAIVETIGAGVAIAKAIVDVGKMLDGARNCVIEVQNHTDQRLEIVSEQRESGGYREPPNQFVDPRTVQIFGAQDNGFWTGAIGAITYSIGRRPPGGTGDHFFVRWANPFIGPNLASVACFDVIRGGAPFLGVSTAYRGFGRAGTGDENAHMLFQLYLTMEIGGPGGPFPV